MADLLRTDYKDDILNTEVNTQRKYRKVQNDDGTVSFEDVTAYSQVGDSFGASDINKTNLAIDELNNAIDEMFITKSFQQKTTISAGQAVYVEFDVALEGYTPLSIHSYSAGNSTMSVFATILEGNTAKLGIYAIAGAEGYRRIDILYKKNKIAI